jgi:hypothetical protein
MHNLGAKVGREPAGIRLRAACMWSVAHALRRSASLCSSVHSLKAHRQEAPCQVLQQMKPSL